MTHKTCKFCNKTKEIALFHRPNVARCVDCHRLLPSRKSAARTAEHKRADPSYGNRRDLAWDARTDRWLEKEELKINRRLSVELDNPFHPNTPKTILFRLMYRTFPRVREREIARSWVRKSLRRKLLRDGTLTPNVLRRLFADARICPYCDKEMGPAERTLDHMEPISRGGAHSIHNVCVCCGSCNSRKRATPLAVWLAKRAA